MNKNEEKETCSTNWKDEKSTESYCVWIRKEEIS